MKLNDKQREIIVMMMYIFLIIFLCYSSYNELFSYNFIVLIGIVVLFICKKIYPDEKILNNFNTESEIHSIKNWNKNNFYKNIKRKYNLYYEEINKDTIDVTIRKYLKTSGFNVITKNKILIVIETSKVNSEIIELIEKLKDDYKESLSKFNVFNSLLIDRFDILIINDDINEDLLQDINSQVLSTVMCRGITCIKCFSIPILICEKENKLYISNFNKDVYSEVVAFSEARRKIRKKLKNKNII